MLAATRILPISHSALLPSQSSMHYAFTRPAVSSGKGTTHPVETELFRRLPPFTALRCSSPQPTVPACPAHPLPFFSLLHPLVPLLLRLTLLHQNRLRLSPESPLLYLLPVLGLSWSFSSIKATTVVLFLRSRSAVHLLPRPGQLPRLQSQLPRQPPLYPLRPLPTCLHLILSHRRLLHYPPTLLVPFSPSPAVSLLHHRIVRWYPPSRCLASPRLLNHPPTLLTAAPLCTVCQRPLRPPPTPQVQLPRSCILWLPSRTGLSAWHLLQPPTPSTRCFCRAVYHALLNSASPSPTTAPSGLA